MTPDLPFVKESHTASTRAGVGVRRALAKGRRIIHLPFERLDYWARLLWHDQRGEFQQYGYFPGLRLAPQPPLLFLVAPSLRVHPSPDTVLRCFSQEIGWTLVGVDERRRDGVRIIYRKAAVKAAQA